MYISIKAYLNAMHIEGDIILYRDKQHKKKAMCEYLAEHISTDRTLCFYSAGAFGLYMAKAFPNNNIVICGSPITPEYRKQILSCHNVVINPDVRETSSETTNIKDYAEANGYYFIDQYREQLIEDYYKKHFEEILQELKGNSIDAFCDCAHSCATLAGAIESGTKMRFIVGTLLDSRENFYRIDKYKDRFIREKTRNFDTKQIQIDIGLMYPAFGNIFEATRSISAAMSWLTKNPGKTVLVYVGDSPVFGKDTTI